MQNSGENWSNRRESAETLALGALSWLLGQPDLVGAFLNASGAAQGQLAELATEPLFLGAVLDFLTEDDARVIAFCDQAGLPYTAPLQARLALPGAQHTHWT